MNPDVTDWYPVNCPPWCESKHAAVLCPPEYLDNDQQDDGQPDCLEWDQFADHGRELVRTHDGLSVYLNQLEAHPASPLSSHEPACYVYTHGNSDAIGVTPDEMRSWAAALTAAATLAESLTK